VGDNLVVCSIAGRNTGIPQFKQWSRALAGEEFTVVDEFGDPTQDGVSTRGNSVRCATHGKLVGAFQFVYDVTDRIRDQARLAEAEAHLRQAQKIDALGQLTAASRTISTIC